MKKISFLLVVICLLFCIKLPVYAENMDILNFKVEISGASNSILDIQFDAEEELEDLIIWVYSDLNDGTYEEVYNFGRIYLYDGKEQYRSDYLAEPSPENNYYHYHFKFNLESGKLGTFELKFKYQLNDEHKQQSIYITNGNPNVEVEVFTPTNALIIGLVASLAAIVITIIVIRNSEKKSTLIDDEEA